jgi:DNA ligase (NAD+)
MKKDLLYCKNPSCDAQFTGKLTKFCKVLKIKGFGPATLAKTEIETVGDLVSLTPEKLKNKGFSDTMANKLCTAIADRLDSPITTSDFLAAMSIPHIGTGTAKKLSHLSVDEITLNGCKKAGLGEVAATSLMTWIEQTWPSIVDLDINLPKATETKTEVRSTGLKVCITGSLDDFKSRASATTHLNEHGIEVKKSLTKDVNYLICEDGKTTSSTYKKAIAAGIPVTTIQKLLEEN